MVNPDRGIEAERECTWCRLLRSFHSEDLAKVLKEYIESLPPDQRTDEEEHARRLTACGECPDNREGLCRYCGCYVAARTAKQGMICPDPHGPRW